MGSRRGGRGVVVLWDSCCEFFTFVMIYISVIIVVDFSYQNAHLSELLII